MFYIGLDVHGKWTTVYGINPETGEVVEHKRLANTREAMYEAFGQLEGPLHGVMETGTNAFAMHRMLSPLFEELLIADPSQLWDRRRDRQAKTDRRDAQRMVEKLYRGEIEGIYVPTVEVQDMRTLGRSHIQTKQWLNKLVCEIGSLLRSWGYVLPGSLLTKAGAELINQALSELPEESAEILREWQGMLTSVQTIAKRIEQRIQERAAADHQCQLLQTMDQVGPITALVMRAEIGDINRFRSADALVSYAGLCPTTSETGGHRSHGHLVPWGDRSIRYVVGLLGARIARSRKDTCLRRLHRRTAMKHDRRSANVAVARKGLRIMFHLLIHNEPYQEPEIVKSKQRAKVAA